mgnify:CR=1 FL=1
MKFEIKIVNSPFKSIAIKVIDKNFNIEDLYTELGDKDIITANEINPSDGTWLLNGQDIFMLTDDDISELKGNDVVFLPYYDDLKNQIDLDIECDAEFAKWYYNSDDLNHIKTILL